MVASVAVAGCSAGAGNPTGKTTQGQFAQGKASGDYAVAQAGGTAYSPSHLQLRLISNPAQRALVSWTMTCTESGGGVGQKSGQSTLGLPTIEDLPLPAPSDSCIVAANAQLSGSGTLNVALYNGNVPAAASTSPASEAGGGSATSSASANPPATSTESTPPAVAPTSTAASTSSPSAAPTSACPSAVIGTPPYTSPLSYKMVSGADCATVTALMRSAWIWRWGVLMWGGVPGTTPGNTSPPGWTCSETFEYFSTASPANQDDGSLTGSVTRCSSGSASFVVTVGRVTPWGHGV
jgi:hypothetical protein